MQLSARLPACRTFVLTGLSRPGNLLRALKVHVRGFILKDAPAQTLADGIRYWDPILIDFGDGADPNGWAVGGDVAVEDTTFFDYGSPHRALTSLTAFRTW